VEFNEAPIYDKVHKLVSQWTVFYAIEKLLEPK
jgi:hypothetical protein